MIWTVDREALLVLGVGRALLLQLAHPLVAAGVADYSDFQGDFFGRLSRTLDLLYTLVFGNRDAAMAAVQRMEAVHRRVQGVLRESVGCFAADTPYRASDPALRLWVQATLIDTKLLVYNWCIRRLSRAEQMAYYADSRHVACLLGIPESMIPGTLEAFQRYMTEMLASRQIAVGTTARTLTQTIFRPSSAVHHRLIGAFLKFVTVGLLPAHLRQQYGYDWSPRQQRMLTLLAGVLRRVVPMLPAGARFVPHARLAEQAADQPAAPASRDVSA